MAFHCLRKKIQTPQLVKSCLTGPPTLWFQLWISPTQVKPLKKNHTTTQFYKLLMLCLMTTFLTMHPNFLFYLKFSQYLVFPPVSEHWPTLLAVPGCPPHLPACSLNDTGFSKSPPHSTDPAFLGQGEHKGDTLILLSDALCSFLHFVV